MKGVTRGIILVLLAVFAVIKAETLAEESVAPHDTLIAINNAEVVAENRVEDDREDERIPTQEDKGITLRTWPFQEFC